MRYYAVTIDRGKTLSHHGIKNQKWGHKNGPPYPLDYESHSAAEKKANSKTKIDGKSEKSKKPNVFQRHKNKLIDEYIKKGYSKENAERAANQRIKTEIIVGSLAAVAVGVVATKGIKYIGEEFVDKTFKSGHMIQNIGIDGSSDFKHNPFFAAVNNHDKKAYGMLYPAEKKRLSNSNDIFKSEIKLNADVKRASIKNARNIFEDKMKSDPNFRSNVISAMKNTQYKRGISEYEKTGKMTRALYDSFNQSLATPAMQNSNMHKEYYSALKNRGYNALLDINDTRYSGYKNISKSPTIFFGDDKWDKIKSTKLSDLEIKDNLNKYQNEVAMKQSLKSLGITGGIIGASKAYTNEKYINDYLKKHPNTKLSNKEILDLYKN